MRALLLVLAAPLALLACTKELVCPQLQVNCGGACVSLTSDAANCGACGHGCGARSICSSGTCECAPGAATCGSACVDLGSDPDHCGACVAPCGGALVCSTSNGSAACTASCAAGLLPCGRACVDEASDPANCGGCGIICAAGQACRAGACRADIQVACGATAELVPVTSDLGAAGPSRAILGTPAAVALAGGALVVATGWPATVAVFTLDTRPSSPTATATLFGNDLEGLAVHDNVVFASNADASAIDVIALDGTLLDEVTLDDPQAGPNPHGLAFVGSTAYAPLYGPSGAPGHEVAILDFSGLAACAADLGAGPCGAGCTSDRHCVNHVCRLPCGHAAGVIDLKSVPGSTDAPGEPLPTQALAVGTKVYVSLANLKLVTIHTQWGDYTGYYEPAGHGKLAVIDTTQANAVSIVDLGPACGNPGRIAVRGQTLWVACSSLSFPTDWPGRVVPVEVSGAPTAGPALDVSAVLPAGVVFCGGAGYVGDMNSGAVLRFDPASGVVEPPVTVCPTSAYGSAYVADIACAP